MSLLDAVLPKEPTKKLMMDKPIDTLFDKTASKLVGMPINRVESALKVSGQATYTSEFYLDNQAYGVLVSATIAKGRVKDIDTSAVEAIPNVIKVITDPKHFLRNAAQGGATDAPTQGVSEIFYHGQPIAVVIAETFEAATEGAKALKVTYDDETNLASLDFNKALPKAHDVDESSGSDKNAKQGNPDQGLADSAMTIDRFYHTPSQNSAAMEPHATLAHWEEDKLIMYSANQMLSSCKKQIADALDLDAEKVQLIAKYVGGGFGSKLGISPESIAAAIAAKELQRPVLVVMTRPQVLEATIRRSNTRQRIAIGCDDTGLINTIIHDTVSSNLPDEAFFEPAALSTQYLYRGENRRVDYKKTEVNQVLAGSMRAPGEAVGQIALECAMDELAEKLSLDPIEFRRMNEPEQDPSQDIPFSTRQLIACMDKGAEQFGWNQRNAKPASRLEGDWWLGVGMAAASRGNNLGPSEARAILQVDHSKSHGVRAIIETDMTDIGTGSYTVFTQIAADLLGLPIDHIEMKLGDTSLPPAVGSGGSMGAASSGSSIYLACQQLREMIAKKVGLHADTIQLDQGQIKQAGEHKAHIAESIVDAGKDLASSLADNALHALKQKTGFTTAKPEHDTDEDNKSDAGNYDFSKDASYSLAKVIASYNEQRVSAKGFIAPGKNANSHRQASYGANFAEVAVHKVTGEIRVKRMSGAFAAGRILNQKTATSQCYGGMIFGIGSALMEQIIYDKNDGRLCNHDLAEYHIPVNADVPQLEVILVEEDDRYTNPMHIKGIGETAIAGAAAAIANAVYNAIGVRVYDFPITMDKILADMPE